MMMKKLADSITMTKQELEELRQKAAYRRNYIQPEPETPVQKVLKKPLKAYIIPHQKKEVK
jgi:hypothetical protein